MELEWVSGGLLSLDVEGRGPQCCQNSLKLPEIMKKKNKMTKIIAWSILF